MPKGVYIRSEVQKSVLRQYRIGKSISNETRQKMSLAHIGKVHSEETKQKIRIANLGDNSPHYGKTISKETRLKLSILMSGNNNHNYGKSPSEETRKRLSKAQSGSKHHNYGKKSSPETKRKQRVAKLNRMFQGDTVMSIGKNETALLNTQEQLDGVTILRQYHIKYLGYITDGYCPSTNIVYEVYERKHLRPKVAARDVIRQKEIEEYLGCNFIIIWDRSH